MTTKIVIIAHAPLATALKDCAMHVYACDSRVAEKLLAVDIQPNSDIIAMSDMVCAQVCASCARSDQLLVLTDLFGASPCNIAQKLLSHADTSVISGANLPMVLAALCHESAPLKTLTEMVIEAGREGIKPNISSETLTSTD